MMAAKRADELHIVSYATCPI